MFVLFTFHGLLISMLILWLKLVNLKLLMLYLNLMDDSWCLGWLMEFICTSIIQPRQHLHIERAWSVIISRTRYTVFESNGWELVFSYQIVYLNKIYCISRTRYTVTCIFGYLAMLLRQTIYKLFCKISRLLNYFSCLFVIIVISLVVVVLNQAVGLFKFLE